MSNVLLFLPHYALSVTFIVRLVQIEIGDLSSWLLSDWDKYSFLAACVMWSWDKKTTFIQIIIVYIIDIQSIMF